MISYDVKALYHLLAEHNISVQFSEVHDVRQAAFLLDPLRRDSSLAGLLGGELKTANEEVAATWQVYGWQVKALEEKPKIQTIAKQFDFPLIYNLFMMEHRGIKLNPEFLSTMSSELGESIEKIQEQMYEMVGYEFNIGSPAQLAEVLFEKLQVIDNRD